MERVPARIRKFRIEDINKVLEVEGRAFPKSSYSKQTFLHFAYTLPETFTIIEVGPVPVVPYAQPLTQKLADNFLPYLQKYNSFIMENHGLVTMTADDIYITVMTAELFECSVKSMLAVLASGELKEISKDDVRDLDNVMKQRGLPLMGAPGVNKSLVDMYF